MAHSITDENFGAWVLKCNPNTWDVVAALAQGEFLIENWSVQDNYRSRSMQAGEPVILWVTGNGSKIEPGIWAIGEVEGEVDFEIVTESDDFELDVDEETGSLWLDEEAEFRAEFFVPVYLPLWASGIARSTIAGTPGLEDVELLRQPQMSNPSWLTKEQYDVLLGLIDEDRLPDRDEEEAALSRAHLDPLNPDPLTRALVEQAAINTVIVALEEQGWEIDDLQAAKVGWDLTARKGSVERFIEVKGRGLAKLDILLTANEHRAARETVGWELAIVTSAVTTPTIHWRTAQEVIDGAAAFQFRYTDA